MENTYKYTVMEIDIPDCETGSVKEIVTWSHVDSAFRCKAALEKENPHVYYEIIVERIN